ncbi:MAG: hypothetical protein HY832_02845 [Candidatus Aenigmarchaeota archaeon]|nr:hypothetical protein [Candidatus Aenigmarchaeota archaeon]
MPIATKKFHSATKTPVKKSKYIKVFIEKWKCDDCSFQWSYRTMKCPLCACFEVVKIV